MTPNAQISAVSFRETHTLSDAVERIGRRLYAHTWTGDEHFQQKVKSPEELANIRAPLEKKLNEASTELSEIDRAIHRTIDNREIEELKKQRLHTQSDWNNLNLQLNHELPAQNDYTRTVYESYDRYRKAESTLLDAVRQRQIMVHDGHGHELSPSVWTHPKFRYCIELSIVVNSKMSGEPRRQAARIDRDPFEKWLATVKPLVESLRPLSVEERLDDFLKQEVLAAKIAPKKTKPKYCAAAKAEIPDVTKRMFDRIWSEVVPSTWRHGGRPKSGKSSQAP